MALRHAVLAVLLDGERSGYELAKDFSRGVANFWFALPQQVYLELSKLEKDKLVTSRQIIQESRPNKRLFTVTEAGHAELGRFAQDAARPFAVRDDLLVKVYAADSLDPSGLDALLGQLTERAEQAAARIEVFERCLAAMRGESGEEDYLRTAERIGPYLTCLRGISVECDTRDWCLSTAQRLRARTPVTG
jgi:DNA-binding PadR family transcriptional regulator